MCFSASFFVISAALSSRLHARHIVYVQRYWRKEEEEEEAAHCGAGVGLNRLTKAGGISHKRWQGSDGESLSKSSRRGDGKRKKKGGLQQQQVAKQKGFPPPPPPSPLFPFPFRSLSLFCWVDREEVSSSSSSSSYSRRKGKPKRGKNLLYVWERRIRSLPDFFCVLDPPPGKK